MTWAAASDQPESEKPPGYWFFRLALTGTLLYFAILKPWFKARAREQPRSEKDEREWEERNRERIKEIREEVAREKLELGPEAWAKKLRERREPPYGFFRFLRDDPIYIVWTILAVALVIWFFAFSPFSDM